MAEGTGDKCVLGATIRNNKIQKGPYFDRSSWVTVRAEAIIMRPRLVMELPDA